MNYLAGVLLILVVAVSSTLANADNPKTGDQGICSWYGAEGEIPPGHPTACNEGFDRFAMKVAHKSLSCGPDFV
ncbi:RlpA-like protein [Orchesella cincta]|uniref:RlpA-like protein n=1 Tax=Orchesella cincta TaxID=48709 RepID=A0A1D2M1W7_ORCCI|nr:RlpA-like protein [Orchesella cincta]